MKKDFIKHEEVNYEIRSMGFFKANALLMGTLKPLLPLIGDITGAIKGGIENLDEGDLSKLLFKLMNSLEADQVNDILREILSETYVDNKKLDLDTIVDYELPVKLIPVIFKLNFSTLGKLLGKLEDLLPED